VRGKEGSSREARIWLLSLSHGGLATHVRMYPFFRAGVHQFNGVTSECANMAADNLDNSHAEKVDDFG
jgi:hypothetical protein